MPFTVGVVQQLHQQVFRYLPGSAGHWKMSDNEIVERHPDGSVRVRFRPVPAVATPHLMREFLEHFAKDQQDRTIDSLVLVPLAILDFLCIHPFTDGNGRVARLVTLLLLYRSGYEVGRYISLERIFEESKESYYETLESSSQGWHEGAHDAHPWLDYFWGVLLRAHREFEDRVGHVTTRPTPRRRDLLAIAALHVTPALVCSGRRTFRERHLTAADPGVRRARKA